MARVLAIEARDHGRVAALFATQEFAVATAAGGREALVAVESYSPSLILLETERIEQTAVRLCERLRSITNAPIVVVSGACSEREVIAIFAAGADTYIPDSVGPHELVARVRALLRRAPREPEHENATVRVGPVVLDGASRELRVNGTLVVLPRREFDIAELLMRKVGRVVTRDELIRELWGSRRDTKSLDVQVGRLRNRLATAEGRRRIVTVRGVGYRFLGDRELDELEELEPEVVIDLRPTAADPEAATIHLAVAGRFEPDAERETATLERPVSRAESTGLR
jgi:DNA-binding response OmpR family regulator